MKEEEINIYSIVIASLLHDIGKFMQRAEVPLSEQSKGMEGIICPVYKGIYSHKHVLWTNEFFEKYVEFFPEELDKSFVANLASFHHRTDNPLQTIISEADRLSSGMERLEKDYDDEITGRNIYKKARLLSIFDQIKLKKENEREIGKYKYNLLPFLPEKERFFPKEKNELSTKDGELLTENYKDLWNEFILKFNKIKIHSIDQYISSILSILEFYTWCIPSSTIDMPDISLFDHSKTSAAIAVCLYKYHSENKTLNMEDIKNREITKFRLVGGDISGIQKYIFDLSEGGVKGAGRILRARSFYIQVLGKVTIHYILHKLNLPFICNIIEAGGKFTLLVPDLDIVEKSLVDVYRDICNYTKSEFNGELTINLNWDTKLKGEDFDIDVFPKIIKKHERNIENEKSRKLFPVLTENKKWKWKNFVMEERYEKYENETCRICNKNPIKKDGGCVECNRQIDLGKWLSSAEFIAFSKEKPDNQRNIELFKGKYFISILKEKIRDATEYYLTERLYKSKEKLNFEFPVKFTANYVPLLSEDDKETICPICKEYNDCNIKINEPKTFTCIANASIRTKNENKKKGSLLLGFEKADIDRLGFIFGYGLGDNISISRYTSLSRMLDIFFTGYLETLIKSEKRFNNIYTVYAGGDDLFLISDWETSILFSERIYKEFREFTCFNDDITLSCGIDINRAKYPVRMAAKRADLNLELSKNKGRNRITFFNTTIKWEDFGSLKDFAEFLKDKISDKKSNIKTGFVHRLLKYHSMAEEAFREVDADVEGLRFHSLMNYDINRNIVELDDNKNIKNLKEVKELLKLYDLEKIDEKLIFNLKIPIFWSLYYNRGGK